MAATIYREAARQVVVGIGVIALLLSATAFAQGKVSPLEVFKYQGADREKKLIENAKKEGKVVVYTSLNLKDSVPITEAFEKKYGIKTVLWRASSEKVIQRSLTETRANRYSADVYETNGPEMEILHREKLLADFYSPDIKDIPPETIPAHRQWIPDRFNFFTIAYNTNLVKQRTCRIPTRTCSTLDGRGKSAWNQAIPIGSGRLSKGWGKQRD